LSRVTGVLRESVFAYFFGATAVADVWRAALRTPTVLQNLLGEGTLSASFIPVYATFLEEGREEEAGRFAGAVLGILTVVAFGLALLGILIAPWMIPLFFPRWEPWMQELGIRMVRILFPMMAVLVVSAWALGILNSHRRFFVSYVAPVAWNLALIGTLAGFGTFLGLGATGRESELVVALAWGALAGGVLQLFVQLPFVLPLLSHFRLSLGRSVNGVAEAIRNFWPVVLARGVVNLSGWVDMILAGLLGTGAIAVLGYAQQFYVLPISLFGMAIAASELPELSRIRGEVKEVLVPRVRAALERSAFLLLPSALAYLLLGDVFTAALFQRGEFGPSTTAVTHAVLAAYSLGLFASGSSRVLSSAFYALRDTRSPAKIAYMRVGVSMAVGFSLMFPLDRLAVGELHMGAVGLALGAASGAWLEYRLLRRRLTSLIGDHGPDPRRLRRIALAGAAALGAGFAAKVLLGFSLRPGLLNTLLATSSVSWLLDPLAALATASAFGVAYLGTAALLGVGMPLRRKTRPGR
jgi:putative peptidoglycan lipid II flippase